MKFTITAEAFRSILATIAPVIPQKPTLPVLANVLLSAKDNTLTLSGTNMDQSIIASVPCIVQDSGTVTVNAKRLLSLVKEMPDGDIHVSESSERISVKYANGSADLMGMHASDYLNINSVTDGVTLLLTSEQMMRLFDGAGFCTATDRTRLSLTGACMEGKDGKISLTTTDGHRLAHCEIPFETLSAEVTAILPSEVMDYATRLAANSGLQSVVIGSGSVAFVFADAILTSKLIEGAYPNWRQVIPAEHDKTFIVSTDDMARAIRRTGQMSNSITHMLKMELSSREAVLSARNQDIGGEARETVSGEYEGENLEIGMNAAYLADILRHIENESVRMEMSNAMSACVIRPVGDDNAKYLIMPLRLND